jgi:hypothetical protein
VTRRLEISLGIDGRHAPGAGCGHRLPVIVIRYVSRNEHTRNIAASGVRLSLYLTVVIKMQPIFVKITVGLMPYSNENSVNRNFARFSILCIFQSHAGDLLDRS